MRRGKASLVLMEQLVMLLVFALAAAVCLRVFVSSDQLSRRIQAQDRAAELAQNAAETLRHAGGDFQTAAQLLGAQSWNEDALMIDYDSDWALAHESMRYTLGVSRLSSDVPLLGRAQVWCRDEVDGQELLRLDVAWQEVTGDGT